jgi:hypothetical protein
MNHETDDRKHPAVNLEVGSWSAEIDLEIAPLIEQIWIAGIETYMSCQEDGWGKVWIAFHELEDLVRFLNAVAEYQSGPDTLYNRMNPNLRCEDPDLEWIYDMHPDDLAFLEGDPCGEESTEPRYEGSPDFFFTFSVRFPPSDLPTVLERMQRFNSAANSLSPAQSQSAANQ